MGRNQDFTDGGIASFQEARANGLNAATLHAPAVLAGSYDMELLDALPAGLEFLQIDAAGKLSTVVGAGGSLDTAYDFGGAGAGRIMTADAGPVEAAGAGGFLASHSAPVYGLETTGVGEFNFRLTAGQATDVLEIQRGDQDADISDDTFDALFALDGVNRRLGINTTAPATLAHLLSPSGDAKLTIQAPLASDASVIFNENAIARFELGYDDSAGGLVVGLVDFTDPIALFEDTTGTLRLGDIVGPGRTGTLIVTKPDATAQSGTVFIEDTVGGATMLFVLKSSTSASDHVVARFENDRVDTTVPVVQISQVGDGIGLDIDSNAPDGFPALNVLMTGTEAAALFRRTTLSAGGPVVHIQDDIGAVSGALLVDQNQNSEGIIIDSEATSSPLIDLQPITGNTRGDIAFGAARTADPTTPSEGDIWYEGTLNRFAVKTGLSTGRTAVSQYGPNFGEVASAATIATGVITVVSGHIVVTGETSTDNLDTINSSPQAAIGDTILVRANSGDAITLRGGIDNLKVEGPNPLLDTVNDNIILMWNGTQWIEVSRATGVAA